MNLMKDVDPETLQRFKEVPGKWRFLGQSIRHAEIRDTNNGLACPIVALAKQEYGNFEFANSQYRAAANLLGINPDEADRIAIAADDTVDRKTFVRERVNNRDMLLRVCGLEEEE